MGTCQLSRPLDQYHQLEPYHEESQALLGSGMTNTIGAVHIGKASNKTLSKKKQQQPQKPFLERLWLYQQQRKALRERRRLDAEGSFSCNIACPWKTTHATDDHARHVHKKCDATMTSTSSSSDNDDHSSTHDVWSPPDEELCTIDEQFEIAFSNSIEI